MNATIPLEKRAKGPYITDVINVWSLSNQNCNIALFSFYVLPVVCNIVLLSSIKTLQWIPDTK